MAVSDLRRFLTKYNRAREHLHRGNFQACQMNLGEAIKNRLKGQFLKADRELIDQDLFTLVSQVTAHKSFKEAYGPVTIVEGQMEQWLALFDQVVFLESEIYDRLKEAQERLDAKQVEAARELFDGILADFADDPGVAIDIGDRYMDRRLYADAGKAYRQAVSIDPNALHTLNRLAVSLRKESKFEEAIKVYSAALKISPEDEGLYYNTARALFEMGRIDLALRMLSTALKKNPGFEAGQKFYQYLKERQGQAASAEESPEE